MLKQGWWTQWCTITKSFKIFCTTKQLDSVKNNTATTRVTDTYLFSVKLGNVPAWTPLKTHGLTVASRLAAQHPYLLYSNGQRHVTRNLTLRLVGRIWAPQLHMETLGSPSLPPCLLWQTSLSGMERDNTLNLCCFFQYTVKENNANFTISKVLALLIILWVGKGQLSFWTRANRARCQLKVTQIRAEEVGGKPGRLWLSRSTTGHPDLDFLLNVKTLTKSGEAWKRTNTSGSYRICT